MEADIAARGHNLRTARESEGRGALGTLSIGAQLGGYAEW